MTMFKVPEHHRLKGGPYGSDESYANNGIFYFTLRKVHFAIIASDGLGWEHVSVHCIEKGKDRTPTWDEMCYVKDLFWDPEDTVVQYHPAKSEYVNRHPHTLHLWRQTGMEFPVPGKIMVG